MTDRATTVIVPAHNEAAVISRTLSALLAEAAPTEFAVVVVCNGCSDRTADVVRREFPHADVIELPEASKPAAINGGLRHASGSNVLLLDADIELGTASARALIDALREPGREAAIGHMHVDLQAATWPVRAFYRVWRRHPYLAGGKFAAAIALTATAVARIGQLPRVIADDTYLRRQFSADEVAVVDAVSFTARAPQTLSALVRVRARVHRGNRELGRGVAPDSSAIGNGMPALWKTILRQPALWLDVPWYCVVQLAARVVARAGSQGWAQDTTTRQAAGQE